MKALHRLNNDEKKEYDEFIRNHVKSKKSHSVGYKSCMALSTPKDFEPLWKEASKI